MAITRGPKKAVQAGVEMSGKDDFAKNYNGKNWYQYGIMIVKHPRKRLYFVGPDSYTNSQAVYYMDRGQ